MKFLVGFSAFFLLSVIATAQDTTKHDPLIGPFGNYPVYANSLEILSITDSIKFTSDLIPSMQILDLNSSTQLEASEPCIGDLWNESRWSDCITGDFDGDGTDELVHAFITQAGQISLRITKATRLKPTYQWQWNPLLVANYGVQCTGPIRLIAVDLDSNATKKEFILCVPNNGILKIFAYSLDENSGSINEITNLSINYNAPYDIALGDINADGFDDLVYVYHGINGSNHYMTIGWNKYNPGNRVFSFVSSSSVPATISQWNSWKRLKITTGDFRNLGHDEIVVSYTIANGNNGRQVYNYITAGGTFLGWWTLPGTSPSGWSWALGWESDATAADINPNKKDGDELIVAGPGEVAVLKFNSSLEPYYCGGGNAKLPFLYPGSIETFERRRFTAVGDIDADTSGAPWIKEIIVAEHKQDSTTVFRVLMPNIDADNNITGLTEKVTYSSPIKSSISEMVLGDFDGDAIRLGTPKLITKEFVYQPIVQLNVPPTHFDYLNNQVYDVCKVYGSAPSEFKVTYSETQSSTSHFSSELSQSWGVSGELSGGFSLFGFGIKAYVKASYDNGYYGSQTLDTTVTTQQVIESTGDDWILSTITDYDFWEYPVYAMGEQMGNVLIMIPHFRGTEWFPTRNVIARNWMADHEVGNLFSYPPKEDISNWVGSNRLLTTFTGKYVSQASSGSWTLDLSTQQIDDQMLTSAIGTEVGLSVKNWGIEAKVSGRYSREEITTHTSTATKNVEIEVIVSDTDPLFGDTDYLVTPYIYWGQNGSMVIDYAIDPSSSGDTLYGTFWDDNYLVRSDPGLILPWRLDSLKGIGNTGNLKFYSKSLHVSPSAPSAGDTAFITANIHNFSLKNTAGPVTIRFYLGNPTNGGTPIVGIDGLIDLTTDGPIMKQNRAQVDMEWIVPAGLDNTARIYAVIDPDNTITEVHEDNNIGFVPLMVQGTTDIEDETKYQLPDRYTLEQNYPNPFNPNTTLRYSIPQFSNVIIKIFDVLGTEIETLVDEEKPVGTYELNWNAANLPSGVYFYRIQAGSFVQTRKMILLK